ncbi:hypothetical protein H696_00612 [Fonticula alba]|uniref:NEDD8-activating enzyme E1 catalytic subunit n=1 Tax=Fonticula alba TaxID=691883 RepID=A0A058ZGH8_FONAL|nr:hypothetical protein H696_00612 [Fonticula alba]KCV73066.1 hypothetical protein H696_00612 [Fonticula alba]|eukprot:XP_009492767.1 hypothetical protein H696_00612 [Fonticula alba]
MDTVEVSNLHRQFLFRERDVGRPKAEVAAQVARARFPQATVESVCADLTQLPRSFFHRFQLILSGLDSIEARRWVNITLHRMVDMLPGGGADPATAIPLIDCGSEGLSGQVRIIIPGFTSCIECQAGLYPNDETAEAPLCTLAGRPRTAGHCIAWAVQVDWPARGPGVEIQPENEAHISWLAQSAAARAQEFGIPGVGRASVVATLRQATPAVVSTNALIAGIGVGEALKLATGLARPLDDYMSFHGEIGVYSGTFRMMRLPGCAICSRFELREAPAS